MFRKLLEFGYSLLGAGEGGVETTIFTAITEKLLISMRYYQLTLRFIVDLSWNRVRHAIAGLKTDCDDTVFSFNFTLKSWKSSRLYRINKIET